MADNSPPCMKSFSDSEIGLLDSEKFEAQPNRTRNHSEENFTFRKPHQLIFTRNRNGNSSDTISDINNKSFEDVISSLKSFSIPSKQGTESIDEKVKISTTDNPSYMLDQGGEIKSLSRNKNALEDKQNRNENIECEYNADTILVDYLEDEEISTDDGIIKFDDQMIPSDIRIIQSDDHIITTDYLNNQNSFDAISKKEKSFGAHIDKQKSDTRTENVEMSSPYQVLQQVNLNALDNNFLGEPRCLAIKKYAADEDEEFDLDLVMTADIEDDDDLLLEKQLETAEKKKNPHSDPNDMFLDDDSDGVTEVKSIKYVNLASPAKNGKAWGCTKLEKEEGELSPDLYRINSEVNSKSSISKKARVTESNLEFLNKVNRCFRQLEREFSNMHVPHESKRVVGHLRDLLCVVERMKRKLTVLIGSANSRRNVSHSKSRADENSSSKEKNHKNDEKSHNTVGEENSKDIINPDFKGFDDIQTKQLNKYLEERRKKYYEKRAENYLSQNVLAPQQKLEEVLTKKEHLRRLHSGSKIERQRIKSLFKRQMNLITQQIIQQNDQDKHHTPKKISGSKATSQQAHRPNLENLKSLDDMECFLDLLKTKKGQKITPEDIIRDIRKKKLLKFTTKKRSPVPKKRALPFLLTAAKEDEISIPEEMTNSSVNSVQLNIPSVNVQLEKRAENPENVCQKIEKTTKEVVKNLKEQESNKMRDEQTRKHSTSHFLNTEKFCQQNEKPTKNVVRNPKEHESDKMRDEQPRKTNSSHFLNAKQSFKSNLSKLEEPKEQKVGKNMTKEGQIDNESKEPTLNEIEFCGGENVLSSLKEVIDSSLLKRNSKESKRGDCLFHSRASDFEKDSWEIFPENSKKRIRKKTSNPKSSESDSDSQRDQILKKRKRDEREGDSRRKLSSGDSKRDLASERKSGTRYRSDDGAIIDGLGKKLPEELLTKKLFIVGDKNLAILDDYFCVKVKDNQLFLKKVGKSEKSRHRERKEQRSSPIKERQKEEEESSEKEIPRRKDLNRLPSDSEDVDTTLKEMEDFLQQLRSKKVSSEKQHNVSLQNQQIREMKFMARIQAKRKAKLMACVSTTPSISEKEAKFLKDFENRSKNAGESPETESKKQKLMEKIRAETDFIVLSQKQAAALEDDPLSDVKTFLNMIKEAESANDENSKQFYVSFSLKRSDVKQLENITTGKASALSEESQRLLNSVRAKMRAKKAPLTIEKEVM